MAEPAIFVCTNCNSYAEGYFADGYFVVKKGARVSSRVVPSMEISNPSSWRLRKSLSENGTIIDGVLQHDYRFSSPTAATCVITGIGSSWKKAWIPKTAGNTEQETADIL